MPGDADARYLATIADDCLAILGEGFEIDDLIWDHDLGTRLTLRYRFGGREAETTATGDTADEPEVIVDNQETSTPGPVEETAVALGVTGTTRRAAAVRDYLINSGCDGNMLHVISYGEERPVDPAETEDAYALNRRVQFLVYFSE